MITRAPLQSYAQPGLQYIQGQQIYTAHPQGVIVQPPTAVTTIVAAGQPQPIQQVRLGGAEGNGECFAYVCFGFAGFPVASGCCESGGGTSWRSSPCCSTLAPFGMRLSSLDVCIRHIFGGFEPRSCHVWAFYQHI